MRTTTLTALLFAAFAAVFALLQAPSDSDMFWQLSSGEWTLDHRALLQTDIWSFTRTGAAYEIGAWLGQVALALAYRVGGWLGIDLLRAALVGLAAFFSTRLVLRLQPHTGWAALPAFGTILVSRMVWGDRPQLFTLALFPVVLDLVVATRLDGRTRRLIALPVLLLAWANLHNSFVIGLVALAIVTFDAWLERAPTARPLTIAFVASAVASQINPSGLGAIGRAVSYAGTRANWVVEEHALDVLSGPGLVFAFLLLAALAAAMLVGREAIAARVGAPLLWPGLIVPFAVLALAIQRDTPYACMVLAPFVAAMVPEALGRPRPAPPFVIPPVASVLALAFLAMLVGSVAVAGAPREPDLTTYPSGALTSLRGLPGNMLNEYDWGGYLIRMAPEHPTFIDGRGAALFPISVLDDFQRAVALGAGYRDVLSRRDIAIVLLRPARPLVAALREDGWRVIASDARWVLLART